MHPLLLTLVHKHGQEIARLPRPSEVHGAHISKSDDADKACAKIGRNVSARGQIAFSRRHYASTWASAASVWGSQNVMSISRYNAMEAARAVRACSACPILAYSVPRSRTC
jgi:hypothetical protein